MGISGKLWFVGNGGVKNDEKFVILATTHMVLYPAPDSFHIARSNSADLDLVWLESLLKPYWVYRAAVTRVLPI